MYNNVLIELGVEIIVKTEKNESLESQLYRERMVNRILVGENDELREINMNLYYNLKKYERYVPYIERFRKTWLFRFLKWIKNKFRSGRHE